MGRQKYKFMKDDVVMIHFPDSVLAQASALIDTSPYQSVRISGSEVGNSFSCHITAREILQREGQVFPIRTRKLARYTLDANGYSRLYLPHTCLIEPEDSILWWRNVRNERFQEFTIAN